MEATQKPSRLSLRERLANIDQENRKVIIAYSMILAIILIGTIFITPNFASPTFLGQQLRLASFLGIIAAGQMAVILTGNIDLSVPWTINLSAVLATSVAAGQNDNLALGIAVGLGTGLLVGLVNGIGVAYLRIPSMVLTLGMNAVLKGITVVYTGSAPQFQETPELLSKVATEFVFGFLPVALIMWGLVSLVQYLILNRSGLGRKTYAVGNNEVATYLSGVKTPRVLIMVFVISGVLNSLAGLLIAGNAGRSFNEMGDDLLLPAIAAVVIGGTSILGGSGKYIGTIAGVIIVRLLDGALNIVQVPPASKDIIFGFVILMMLFLYGRSGKVRE
jgi:ribose transport system permease protein